MNTVMDLSLTRLRVSPKAHRLLESARPHRARRLSPRESRVECVAAVGYVAAACAMALALDSSRAFPVAAAVALGLAYAVASRVRLYVGAGYAMPTQLVLVPMFFLLPVPVVPAVAGAALLAAALVDVARGRSHPERAVTGVADAWHVLGGALVLLAAGEPAAGSSATLLVLAALAAQSLVDIATATAREWLGRGIPPAVQLEVVALVSAIDLLLTPVGLLIATAGPEEPLTALALLSLLALLGAAAAERRRRIEEGIGRLDALASEQARLERALRRVGDAFASKLDRSALLELALQTALEALGADRAVALLPSGRMGLGAPADPAASRALVGAVTAARRRAGTTSYEAAGHVAMAHALGAGRGVLCVARGERPFSDHEQDLFGHLCRQAITAIENTELHDRLRRQATQDELTGLANHRRFQEALAEAAARAGRTGQPLALVMLDIDDFKAVNDQHGHQRGDAVLRAVARAVREGTRRTDEPARYGGEELAIVLPDTDADGAYVLAEALRAQISRLHVQPDGPGLPVTVSVGIAAVDSGHVAPDALIAAADAALYEAKRTGKDRTVRGTLGAAGERGQAPFRGLPVPCPAP